LFTEEALGDLSTAIKLLTLLNLAFVALHE
jgi:hypothetical protein